MIVSHKYKFIFIKTTKTAGTSVEIALSKFLGPNDIITPLDPQDEKLRQALGFRGAQNYLAPFWNYNRRGIADLLLRGKRKKRFHNHISARKVKGYVGKHIWDNYYKFCFERNPWDRFVSMYYWRCRSGSQPSISEFIESDTIFELKKRGFRLYTIDGKIALDKVCRFENLSEELEAIRVRLGVPAPLELPHAKSGHREDKRNYCDILNEDQRNRIAKIFSEEIELFEYEY